ncbi:hypothetical protein IWQ60_000071 [Tieghemiomyces parasiticus]|uniref:Uncharacterized protein n=1 Tax=Tieghemiomyces parasiticus TaxID=78921 RepID=A0A9W8ANB0_9FUNG|nr:hypothetical protein IWQ60_000071 [Tieghemiomyces parasiticus]
MANSGPAKDADDRWLTSYQLQYTWKVRDPTPAANASTAHRSDQQGTGRPVDNQPCVWMDEDAACGKGATAVDKVDDGNDNVARSKGRHYVILKGKRAPRYRQRPLAPSRQKMKASNVSRSESRATKSATPALTTQLDGRSPSDEEAGLGSSYHTPTASSPALGTESHQVSPRFPPGPPHVLPSERPRQPPPPSTNQLGATPTVLVTDRPLLPSLRDHIQRNRVQIDRNSQVVDELTERVTQFIHRVETHRRGNVVRGTPATTRPPPMTTDGIPVGPEHPRQATIPDIPSPSGRSAESQIHTLAHEAGEAIRVLRFTLTPPLRS